MFWANLIFLVIDSDLHSCVMSEVADVCTLQSGAINLHSVSLETDANRLQVESDDVLL